MITFIKRLVWGIILNSLAIIVLGKLFNYWFNDFFFKGDYVSLIVFAIILTILNFLLKPILRFVFLPVIWLTLGIFGLIINLLILKIATIIIPDILIINSFLTWILASFFLSVVNSFLKFVK
ncbi:MAG: phage holin family protein [Minisyncoccia bacterium]